MLSGLWSGRGLDDPGKDRRPRETTWDRDWRLRIGGILLEHAAGRPGLHLVGLAFRAALLAVDGPGLELREERAADGRGVGLDGLDAGVGVGGGGGAGVGEELGEAVGLADVGHGHAARGAAAEVFEAVAVAVGGLGGGEEDC